MHDRESLALAWIGRSLAVAGFAYEALVLLSPGAATLPVQQGLSALIAGLVIVHLARDERFLTRFGGSFLYGCALTTLAAYFVWGDWKDGFRGLSVQLGLLNAAAGLLLCALAWSRRVRLRRIPPPGTER